MSGDQQPAVTLACQPARDGEDLVFPYRLTNTGPVAVYVYDAVPNWNPQTGEASLDRNAAYIALAPDGFAHILRGIAPLPTDQPVSVRIIPLATRLEPGAVLERSLTVHQPMHETGPYHPDLPIRQYRTRPIGGVQLGVQFLAVNAPGFVATPYEAAPELARVAAANTVGASRTVWCSLPARGLSILTRMDAFPRPD